MEEKRLATHNDIKSMLLDPNIKKQIAQALPKHLTPDRFIRIAIIAYNKNPKLRDCTPTSLLSCIMDLSQLGLEPDGRKAHLIPFKDQCTLIIDYKGLVELARRSGEISDIHADVVYSGDKFEHSYGSNGALIHKPALSDRGNPIAAYSFVRLKDGSTSYEVMGKEEIEAIHARSRAKDSGPWITDWAEMAKKTVFRRHSKWLPVSPEFQQATEKDYDVPIDIAGAEVNGKEGVILPEKELSLTERNEAALQKARAKIGTEKFNAIIGNLGYPTLEDVEAKDVDKVLKACE